MDKWSIEPIDEGVSGWGIVSDNKSGHELGDTIAVVMIDEDLDESKEIASLIRTAPELLEVCKKMLISIDKNNRLYSELKDTINRAENYEDEPALAYFDDIEDEYIEPVIEVDFEDNSCTYNPVSTMTDLFLFESFGDGIGSIGVNIAGNFHENIDIYYSLKYPIGHLLSEEAFYEFLRFISNKYKSLSEFMTDFDSRDSKITLNEFIESIFINEFAPRYKLNISFKEYLNKYAFIKDTEELYLNGNIPAFLKDLPHSIHFDIGVTHNGTTTVGTLFYNESTNRFYIYNFEDKSASFHMIGDEEEDINGVTVEFIDLIQKKY